MVALQVRPECNHYLLGSIYDRPFIHSFYGAFCFTLNGHMHSTMHGTFHCNNIVIIDTLSLTGDRNYKWITVTNANGISVQRNYNQTGCTF